MSYDRRVLEAARLELEQRKQTAEASAAARQQEFFQRCPRAEEIRRELAHNAAAAARAVVSGGDVRAQMERHKAHGLALSREYDALLAGCGLTRRDLAPSYHCPECKDTGFVDGRMCACYRQLRKQTAYRQLSNGLPLAASSFERFSLECYQDDPRALKQMGAILRACREYAERLRPHSPSLLFYGGTGLGKTHLSLAIANAAIEKGFGVVYGSVQSFTSSFEKERFDREDEQSTAGSMKDCDLLILDDLGTELTTPFVQSALYGIVNGRIVDRRATILSTNLKLDELARRYTPQTVSRIEGEYQILPFFGEDIRRLKKERR